MGEDVTGAPAQDVRPSVGWMAVLFAGALGIGLVAAALVVSTQSAEVPAGLVLVEG